MQMNPCLILFPVCHAKSNLNFRPMLLNHTVFPPKGGQTAVSLILCLLPPHPPAFQEKGSLHKI